MGTSESDRNRHAMQTVLRKSVKVRAVRSRGVLAVSPSSLFHLLSRVNNTIIYVHMTTRTDVHITGEQCIHRLISNDSRVLITQRPSINSYEQVD